MGNLILVVLQTTEFVLPGSNPASLTVENSEDRQSHCVYCKISGQRRSTLPPEPKKRYKKNKKNNSPELVDTIHEIFEHNVTRINVLNIVIRERI